YDLMPCLGGSVMFIRHRFASGPADRFSRIESGYPSEEREGAVFIGERRYIEQAIGLELDGCDPAETAHLYGYPSCCAEAYRDRIQAGDCSWLDAYFDGVENGASLPWEMNRFGRLFSPYLSLLPDYFPCSARCEESLALGRLYGSVLLETGLEVLYGFAKDFLSRAVGVKEGRVSWHPRATGNDSVKTEEKTVARTAFAGSGSARTRGRPDNRAPIASSKPSLYPDEIIVFYG
ncbi:MAG: hypothetical protein K2H64_00995, partial [Desulfovibrio sp.]|nr:hypothetical protein [Desulfovibrio sp.]